METQIPADLLIVVNRLTCSISFVYRSFAVATADKLFASAVA